MEQEQAPQNSKIADLTKKELTVLCVLTVTLLIGIGVKCASDHRWWGEDVKVIKGHSDLHYRIDINKADWSELMLLKGIGEAKAKSIVKYRKEHGHFDEIEELAGVDGISKAMVKKIAELVTVCGGEEVRRLKSGKSESNELTAR